MAKIRKGKGTENTRSSNKKAYIENAGVVIDQNITSTLEKNYMPYAMSVIISRAIPEIDGFKPSHRKLLYTMYKMNLLTGPKTKSANVVGQTMRLNPHGDMAIYETMVRLSRGNEALLHPYVDSKGNFGKSYSRDMAFAASRYTEVKLDGICEELFRDIDKDTVEFVDNYDNTTKEPTLLPVTFPSILVNANKGIAVAMASSICPFNLEEVCSTTIELIKNPNHDILLTLTAPDFPGGGQIIYNQDDMRKIYQTGVGSFRVRSRYNYDKSNNCIEITEIPPTATTESIIDKVVDMIKTGKIKEISDMRDETDLSGLKLTIDLKRGVDPDVLMQKLFRFTPLDDAFACNFNVLIDGSPKVMGVEELLKEWIKFRTNCVKRRVIFDLRKAKDKQHLLEGLQKILLDIDKAIKIIRETSVENEVIPNLMVGFGIDEIQAKYVSEIRLIHLNKEHILKRTNEISTLIKDIEEMEAILESPKKINNIIISELKNVIKSQAKSRKTLLIYKEDVKPFEIDDSVENYAVNFFFSKEGYFKKITMPSYRMNAEHYLKEGDGIIQHVEGNNIDHLLFFTQRGQVYKIRACEIEDSKASVLGDFIPARLGMEDGENAIYMAVTNDYNGFMLFFFENGKVAKVPMRAYETKNNRRKLLNAYSTKCGISAVIYLQEDQLIYMESSCGRRLIFDTSTLAIQATKVSQGVAVMQFKKGAYLSGVRLYSTGTFGDESRYIAKTLPSRGGLPKPPEQLEL